MSDQPTDQPTPLPRDPGCAHPIRDHLNNGWRRCRICHQLIDPKEQPR